MISDLVEPKSGTKSQQEEIQRIFDLQKANQLNIGNSRANERISKLTNLNNTVLKYQQEIRDALHKDYRKSEAEVDLTEIYVVTSEIKHANSNLRKWMSTKGVPTPLAFMGASSRIVYEPKGVSLIIGPWNYPFQLAIGPLVSAIAAGNTVILKPSEHTPNTSQIIKKIINEVFNENEVAVIEGAIDTSTELLKLPFNHIFFTGSPAVGKIVMKAASKNLTSVTLELGGKSPTIIDETANLSAVIKRIAWAKFSNCGQICIAPDYVFIHSSKKDEFVEKLKKQVKSFYGDDVKSSEDYMRIINNVNFNRVKTYLEDSIAKGAKILMGGQMDAEENYIEPTAVTDVAMDSMLMQEEIFGPVLPILTYDELSEVTDYINQGEKPLALYIYSSKKKNIDYVIKNTRAGGTCVNNSAVHFFNNNLPFGGSNNSGIGKSHGKNGFLEFSNQRGIYQQHVPGALELLMPPYNNKFKKFLTKFTLRWL